MTHVPDERADDERGSPVPPSTTASAGRLSGLRVLVAHPGAELYGSDRVVLESVAAMVGAGAAVEVTVPASGPLVDELERAGAAVVIEPSLVLRKQVLRPRHWLSTLASTFRAIGASRRLLRHRPDLVYVNTVTLPLWPLLARLRGVPVLTHLHEAEAAAPRLVLMAMYGPHLAANTVIANSEFSRSVVGRAFRSLASRTRVIYNGVTGPASPAPARERLDGRAVRLAYVGRLSPRKGPDLLLAAAGRLVDDGADVDVDVLGDVFPGYEWFARELRETVARRGPIPQVRFLGFRRDIWGVLDEADIVVIPSRAGEPFGNTAVEAALAGRPIVVSDSSGLREATRDLPGVHRVRPDDPDAIAAAVHEIIARWPSQREQAAAAARLAAARFDPERYRARIVEVVAELARASDRDLSRPMQGAR